MIQVSCVWAVIFFFLQAHLFGPDKYIFHYQTPKSDPISSLFSSAHDSLSFDLEQFSDFCPASKV